MRFSKPTVTRPISTKPTLLWERKLGFGERLIAGVDEVGRGCLAGPVVAAAVILPIHDAKSAPKWLKEIKDSKLLKAEKREELFPLIQEWVTAHCIAAADVLEIDRINIHYASHLAMRRAIQGLQHQPEHILVDGKFIPADLPCQATAIIKGDLKSLSIACASILAKVWRDRLMGELDAQYPGYDFKTHKGYSTPIHNEALKRLGACEIHRKSFAPVTAQLDLLSGLVDPGLVNSSLEDSPPDFAEF